jgi:hypothetical protein
MGEELRSVGVGVQPARGLATASPQSSLGGAACAEGRGPGWVPGLRGGRGDEFRRSSGLLGHIAQLWHQQSSTATGMALKQSAPHFSLQGPRCSASGRSWSGGRLVPTPRTPRDQEILREGAGPLRIMDRREGVFPRAEALPTWAVVAAPPRGARVLGALPWAALPMGAPLREACSRKEDRRGRASVVRSPRGEPAGAPGATLGTTPMTPTARR